MHEARRVSAAGVLLLPAGLVLYFAFNSGGFYPAPTAYAALVLCLILVLRVAIAGTPFAGFSLPLAIAAGSLAGYSLLTLISAAWSHAPGVARVEFDLPLLYLLVMLVFGSIPRTRARLSWTLRFLAVAAVIVSAAGLITRLLPHVWPTSPSIANNRLSFPVTYWNVLGLLAALGIVLCVHFSSDLRESAVGRVVAAGAVPILAATIFFTFSRGAIATSAVALTAYVVIGRPRALICSLLAIVPATVVSIVVAYHANLLATATPTIPAAVVQGRHVAVAVALCAAGAMVVRALLARFVDAPLREFALPSRLRRRAAWTGWISAAIATLIVIASLSGTIASQSRQFLRPSAGNPNDLRTRLTDPANGARVEQWKVAWRQFKLKPVVGQGAGTYQNAWARYRPRYGQFVRDTHSLYLETLDELGVVGLVLLLTTILTVLWRVASRARGSGRPLYAAVFAVLLGWALHAGVDWDWEMPVVTIIFFSLGGFVLARRARPEGRPPAIGFSGVRHPAVRGVVAAVFCLVAIVPALTWLSQRKLDDAAYAFSHADCVGARQSALSSISILGNRPEPYEIVSYCDLRLGMTRAALAAIDKAVSLDPNDWNYRYGTALMRAAAGMDPRAAADEALSLDPQEPLVQAEWRVFHSGTPAEWKVQAKTIARAFTTL